MNELPRIRTAEPHERASLIATAVLGFVADPMVRWTVPDASTYIEAMSEFFDAFGGRAFENGSAWVANDGQALAMWLPPGIEPDGERMVESITSRSDPDKVEEIFTVLGLMEQFHPKEDCWYLPVIGADPAYTGLGLGGMLMKTALERVDRDRLPAYLESSNPRNVSLYERHGFSVIGEIQHGSSPVMIPMLRPART
ncbi:GNAT family N-acetyltransferase [Qipengyuania zhejiangensis]|uniref:GNAT family N-acetyltransferase n=1 Tax=Qipengyuania zhejiangensis TaxID=3077782 RepID=UPI002D77168F|nr:GNAT family N-acetyltransferase [Qipengyuania sp. Z2]